MDKLTKYYEVTCSFYRKGTFLYFSNWKDILNYMEHSVGWDYTITGVEELPADVMEMHQENWGVSTYWAKDINEN